MSVVGPRPALPNEVATYNDYQRQRLLVKPGMTCYWQTRRNRDSITFDEWVDLDLWRSPFLPFAAANGSWFAWRYPAYADSPRSNSSVASFDYRFSGCGTYRLRRGYALVRHR